MSPLSWPANVIWPSSDAWPEGEPDGPPALAVTITSHTGGETFYAHTGLTYTISGTYTGAITSVEVQWNGATIATDNAPAGGTWSVDVSFTIAQSVENADIAVFGNGNPAIGDFVTATVWSPALITSVSKYFWLRADVGGAGSASWTDQFGQYNAEQADPSMLPVVNSSAVDGKAAVTFDGVDDFVTMTGLDFPVPDAGTPIWFWAVFAWHTHASSGVLLGGGGSTSTSTLHWYQTSVPGQFALRNATPLGSPIGSPLAQDTWARAILNFEDSANGMIKIGSAAANNGATGNRDPGTFCLGGRAPGNGQWSHYSLAEIVCFAGEPSELTLLEAYCAALYPSALT